MSEEKKSDLTTLGEIEPTQPIRLNGRVVTTDADRDVAETGVDPNGRVIDPGVYEDAAERKIHKVAENAAAKGMERQQREDPTVFSK
jgi:hypothetical protein